MKQTLHFNTLLFFFLFFIIIFSSRLSAHTLQIKGQDEAKDLNEITSGESNSLELMEKLMGLEACATGDDECFNRRLLSEAHLDYIYTQNHKP